MHNDSHRFYSKMCTTLACSSNKGRCLDCMPFDFVRDLPRHGIGRSELCALRFPPEPETGALHCTTWIHMVAMAKGGSYLTKNESIPLRSVKNK